MGDDRPAHASHLHALVQACLEMTLHVVLVLVWLVNSTASPQCERRVGDDRPVNASHLHALVQACQEMTLHIVVVVWLLNIQQHVKHISIASVL